MKTLLALAAALAVSAPAMAQNTPSQGAAPAATPTGGNVDADAARAAQAGGYQPDGPAMSGPLEPGAKVIFKAAPPPSVAFPAPPPLQHYPVCKKGQFDGCIQPGGK